MKCYYLSLDEPEISLELDNRERKVKCYFKNFNKTNQNNIYYLWIKWHRIYQTESQFTAFSNVVDTSGVAISSIFITEDNNPENIGFIGNLVAPQKFNI